MGSFLTLIITLVLSFPIGFASTVYLEEFAPKNRWTDLIEVGETKQIFTSPRHQLTEDYITGRFG